MRTIKTIFLLATLAAAPAVAGTEGIAISVGSRHYGNVLPCNGAKEYNESNPGLGFRTRRFESLEFEAGVFRNSLDVKSTYGSLTLLPYRSEYLELGLMAGVASGYCSNSSGRVGTGALVLNIWTTKHVGVQFLGIPLIKKITPGVVALRVLVKL